MHLPLLPDIVVILGLSVLTILLFQRLKVPPLLGLLFTGAVAGPHALGLVSASHEVELLSEIGVIFLLFAIGLEFSLKGLSSIRNTVLVGGLVQVGGTIGLTMLVGRVFALPWPQAIFLGFLFSLSSTAIVLKMLQERGEIRSPHGRVSVAILIFQDIVVVPMMLVVPLLAGKAQDPAAMITELAIKVVAVLALVILMARYLVPYVLRLVVQTKRRELFLLTVVVLCFGTAWLTSSVGLSLALGAFFAGLIMSESDYSHQAAANVLPFREIFMSFFFVSVGMLLDLGFLFQHLLPVIGLALAVMVGKALMAALAVLLLRYPPRTVLLSALGLFQVGEFSFLLAATGMRDKLLGEELYQYFLDVSVLSMVATPFVIRYGARITDLLLRTPIPAAMRHRLARRNGGAETDDRPAEVPLNDHIVIIGYGLNGENLARAARLADLSYVVVELDPEVFRKARDAGEPILFGDATEESILQHAHVDQARVVVIAISDPSSTQGIVRAVREFGDAVHIIVRTRYVREIEENLRIGADEVIPEEFETSLEIFSRTLRRYLVPDDRIREFIREVRARNYGLFTRTEEPPESLRDLVSHVPDMKIAALHVQRGRNEIVGKRIGECGLRTRFGVTVLAMRREHSFIHDILPETEIQQDDILYIFGSPERIDDLNRYLSFGE